MSQKEEIINKILDMKYNINISSKLKSDVENKDSHSNM